MNVSLKQKVIIFSAISISTLVVWLMVGEIYILVVAGFLLLLYMVFSKLLKLFILRLKKVPGAGINLRLIFFFIIISSVPLLLTLYFTTRLMNEFIESTFQMSFYESLNKLKIMSTDKLYDR
ncbi:MAG: hypothetical protein OEZ36_14410, partial [Spirochaetota bacterium]|nr:hypothetical protein [Spirochaetota bacterium]